MQIIVPEEVAPSPVSAPPAFQLRTRHVHLHALCDSMSGVLILAMAVFSPWAFGTTQPWSIWAMNIAGYLLGLLLLSKWALRSLTGCRFSAWRFEKSNDHLIWALGAITALLLLYTLVSAINARSTFSEKDGSFVYHETLSWLPQSLDSARTWKAFWMYSAVACSFWAARDWLIQPVPGQSSINSRKFPGKRVGLLCWVLALNGAALSIEGILQRLDGSGELLFLVKPRVNPGAEAQFGPWAYRGNAASYFNLLWPFCLGFWASRTGVRRSEAGVRVSSSRSEWKHHLLFGCVLLMAAAPLVSTSRGGALIDAALLIACCLLLTRRGCAPRHLCLARTKTPLTPILLLAGSVGLGLLFGGRELLPRLAEFQTGFEIREQMNAAARPMATEYPLYGTGAGTFETVFQLYRGSPETLWPAQLHNDWLETRITFGWIGCGLILLALPCLGIIQLRENAMRSDPMYWLIFLAQIGFLTHARWDFPFQIYSTLFLFTLVCAVGTSLRPQTRQPPHTGLKKLRAGQPSAGGFDSSLVIISSIKMFRV